MKMKCPHCGISGSADDSLGGQRVKCPKCNNIFLVPSLIVTGVAEDSSAYIQAGATDLGDYQEEDRDDTALEDDGVDVSEDIDSNADVSSESIAGGVALEAAVVEQDFPDFTEEAVAWEDDEADEKSQEEQHAVTSERELFGETEGAVEKVEKELQVELEAMLARTCSVCGKSIDSDDGFNDNDSLYCHDCFQRDGAFSEDALECVTVSENYEASEKREKNKKTPTYTLGKKFGVGAVLKESWMMTKGIKGSIWGGIFLMFLILFGVGSAAVFFLLSAGAPAGGTVAVWINIVTQLVGTLLAMTFVAGLINIGVKRVAGKQFSWKLVFSGFEHLTPVIIAGFLMILLICSGFFLLVLPGIYLTVGYSMAFPLIIDKGLRPWDAMELSRKTIHNRWWSIFGLYLLMYLICFVSTIPLGIGMIWTVPMFFTLIGVLYRVLFDEDNAGLSE